MAESIANHHQLPPTIGFVRRHILAPVFELTIQREFCAAHAIVIRGLREPVHGHNWRVSLTVRGPKLDDDGLLCDFHSLERDLDDILGPFDNQDLNATPPFDRINPTAERVAEHVAKSMRSRLPEGVAIASVSVTEAPGCLATIREVDA